MKKFFQKALYLGIIVCITGLAGCQNPLEPPRENSASQDMGLVMVNIGGAAAGARTIAPEESEFTKYTLTFTGPSAHAPVDILDGKSASVALAVGAWTINVAGYAGTEGSYTAELATGRGTVTVTAGANAVLSILLGPKTGGTVQGTFEYSLKIPDSLDSAAQLIISTAAGATVDTITLTYNAAGITGSKPLDPGQYLVQVRLKKGGVDVGLTEALHIYSGLTSTRSLREFTDNDFLPSIDIASAAELARIGVASDYPLSGDYALVADITLNNWTPIGDDTDPFTGSFDGQGRSITLQSFDSSVVSDNKYLGIFGYVKGDEGEKAELKNFVLTSQINHASTHATGQAIGVLAGFVENTEIEDIILGGNFQFVTEKNTYFGGVVGYAQKGTTVKDSATSMAIFVDGGSGGGLISGMFYNYAGGVVGAFKDGVDIINCRNTGAVTADCTTTSSQVFCGGIAGGSYYQFTTEYQGKIEDCFSTGDITAKCRGFWSWAGGIAGCMVGDGDGTLEKTTRIMRSWASGTVSVAGSSAGFPYVGGVVGYNYYGALTAQSYFNGNVIADKANDYVGGIAGYNSQQVGHNSRIEDCWSSGTVMGFNNAGGIVGQNQVNTYIRRSYSTAAVIATNTGATGVGGIAGMNASVQEDAITGCVALNPLLETQTGASANIHRVVGNNGTTTIGKLMNNLGWSGMTVNAAGTYTPAIGADAKDGVEIAVQPSQADYVALGWDFGSVWEMDSYGYPKLKWQTTVLPRAPLAGPVPVVSVLNNNHYDTAANGYTANAGGKLTISWQPVPGATSYDIFYAPRVTTAPEITEAVAVNGVTGTSREITGTAIGENTMNYYVWIRANNAAGSSAATRTSTMDYFLGGPDSTMALWEAGFYEDLGMDYYVFTNADIMYESGYFPGQIYGFLGYIRAIVSVPNVRDYIERDGPGGVIIFEYDRDYMAGSGWMLDSDDDEDDYFGAQYYYAKTGTDDNPGSTNLGAASSFASEDAQGDCEVRTLEEALARFTYDNIKTYYSFSSGVEARYSLYEE